MFDVGFDLSVLSDIYRNHFGDGDDVDGHQKPWLVLMVNRDDGSAVVVVVVAVAL
jgi:hypothetical protein